MKNKILFSLVPVVFASTLLLLHFSRPMMDSIMTDKSDSAYISSNIFGVMSGETTPFLSKPKTRILFPLLYGRLCGRGLRFCIMRPSVNISEGYALLNGTDKPYYEDLAKFLTTLFQSQYFSTIQMAVLLDLGKIDVQTPESFPKVTVEGNQEELVPPATQKDFLQKLTAVTKAVVPLITQQAEDAAKAKNKTFKGAKVVVEVVDEDGFANQFATDNQEAVDVDGKKKSHDDLMKEAREEYNKPNLRAMTYTNSRMSSGSGANKVPLIKIKFFADKFAGLTNPAILQLIVHEWVHAKAFILWRAGLMNYNDPLMDHDSDKFKGEEKKFGDAVKLEK